jgi:hypothetical protein
MVWALRRASNTVDRWDGATHRRVLVVNGRPLGIEVVQVAPPERPMLRVTVSGSNLRNRCVALTFLGG